MRKIRQWVLRTFFQDELGSLIAKFLRSSHEAEEDYEAHRDGYDAGYAEALGWAAHELSRVMGQDLSWHK